MTRTIYFHLFVLINVKNSQFVLMVRNLVHSGPSSDTETGQSGTISTRFWYARKKCRGNTDVDVLSCLLADLLVGRFRPRVLVLLRVECRQAPIRR